MQARGLQIAVIGPSSLQNRLLVVFLQEKTAASCVLCENESDSLLENGMDAHGLELVLYDCYRMNNWEILDFQQKRRWQNKILILFNLDPEVGVENDALAHGVRGFVYVQESADTLLKAIEAVVAGDVWMSRKKLAACLAAPSIASAKGLPDLTKREAEILFCLTKGFSNQMIGEQLCISPHTVKAHLSNIFKKIDVPNRRRAARWAENYLCGQPQK